MNGTTAQEDEVGIIRRRKARPRAYELREVGTCGCCQQPVCFDAEIRVAACPCGATSIPRRFMLAAIKS